MFADVSSMRFVICFDTCSVILVVCSSVYGVVVVKCFDTSRVINVICSFSSSSKTLRT